MGMEVTNVCFKSTPENYAKEKSGKKPCTVRFVDSETDPRFWVLRQLWEAEKYKSKPQPRLRITIQNTKTGEKFERLLTDITFWSVDGVHKHLWGLLTTKFKVWFCVLSWRP